MLPLLELERTYLSRVDAWGKSTLDKLKKEFTTSNRSQVIEQILPLLTEKLVESELEYPDNCNDPIKFTWGKIPLVSTKKRYTTFFSKNKSILRNRKENACSN